CPAVYRLPPPGQSRPHPVRFAHFHPAPPHPTAAHWLRFAPFSPPTPISAPKMHILPRALASFQKRTHCASPCIRHSHFGIRHSPIPPYAVIINQSPHSASFRQSR